jgi:hypothetical protein
MLAHHDGSRLSRTEVALTLFDPTLSPQLLTCFATFSVVCNLEYSQYTLFSRVLFYRETESRPPATKEIGNVLVFSKSLFARTGLFSSSVSNPLSCNVTWAPLYKRLNSWRVSGFPCFWLTVFDPWVQAQMVAMTGLCVGHRCGASMSTM